MGALGHGGVILPYTVALELPEDGGALLLPNQAPMFGPVRLWGLLIQQDEASHQAAKSAFFSLFLFHDLSQSEYFGLTRQAGENQMHSFSVVVFPL